MNFQSLDNYYELCHFALYCPARRKRDEPRNPFVKGVVKFSSLTLLLATVGGEVNEHVISDWKPHANNLIGWVQVMLIFHWTITSENIVNLTCWCELCYQSSLTTPVDRAFVLQQGQTAERKTKTFTMSAKVILLLVVCVTAMYVASVSAVSSSPEPTQPTMSTMAPTMPTNKTTDSGNGATRFGSTGLFLSFIAVFLF